MTSPEPQRRTTTFIVDDHPIVREGIRMLIDDQPDLCVVGSSATAIGALAEIAALAPDVLILDLQLGDEDGLQALPAINASAPGTRVLIVTAFRDRARDEAALRAGARGVVLKDSAPGELLAAIRELEAGGLWFDPRVVGATAPQSDAQAPAVAKLTPREREIIALLGEGLRNEEVARRLGITAKTVRNHLTTVFDKLGVSGRLELLVFAYQHGLVRMPS